MDSPLDFFRRNQKTMLPIIAIGCMVAFVVLPGLLGLLAEKQQNKADENPVLYKWQEGDIRQRELQLDMYDYERLSHLVARVATQKSMLMDPQSTRNPNQTFNEALDEFRQIFPGPAQGDYKSAVDCKLYDQIAKELGIVVSEKQVNQFLDDLCGRQVMGPDGKPTGAYETVVLAANFDAILQDVARGDTSFNQARVFALFQQLMKRKEVAQVLSLDNFYRADTPLARWENYRRMEQRASIQAIPVPVSEFVEQVRKPTDEEIAVFFEDNKSRLPNPNFSEVGFRLPNRATFQVASLDAVRMAKGFEPRIDNKAISDFYEKNKVGRFTKTKPLSTFDSSNLNENKTVDPTAPQTPEVKPGDSKTPETGAPEASKTEPAKTEPAKTEPAKADPTKTEPAKTEPAKTVPEAPKPEAPQPDGTKKQSGLSRDGLLPVKFQADPKKEPAQDAPKTSDPAKPEAAKDPAKTEAGKGEPANTEPAKPEPAKPEPAKPEPATAEAGKADPGKTEPTQGEPTKSEPLEFRPLAEVEGEIRRELAQEQANVLVASMMQKIEDEMAQFKKRRDRTISKAEEQGSTPQLEEFDLAKIVAAINPDIKVEVLPLVSQEQFAKHPIADTTAVFSVFDSNSRTNVPRSLQLKNAALSEKVFPLFEPYRPKAADVRYIIWKTEQRGEETPKLEDPGIREQVVATWKMVEARKEAKSTAERYAKLAREAISKAKQDEKAKADEKSKTEDKAKSEDKAKPESDDKAKSDEKVEPKTDDKPKSEDKSKTDDKAKSDDKAEAKTDDQPKSEEQPKPENKTETLVDLYNAKVLPIAPSEINSFSWITRSLQGGRPGVSNVSGLVQPGDELMKVIFDLKQDQIGVAPNRPKSIYYVVQVTQAADLVKLNEEFLKDVKTTEGWGQYFAANLDQRIDEEKAFVEQLRKRFKVEATGIPPYKQQREE